MQESGDIREDMSSAENGPAVVHEFSNGVLAISYALLKLGGDQSDSLCLIEAETTSEAFLRKRTSLEAGK